MSGFLAFIPNGTYHVLVGPVKIDKSVITNDGYAYENSRIALYPIIQFLIIDHSLLLASLY